MQGVINFMKVLLRILLMSVSAAVALPAVAERTDDMPEPAPLRRNYVRSYSWKVDEEGDTVPVINLRGITVFKKWDFKNKKEEDFYWRTVRDVKLTLPYAKLIAETLVETYEYIETFPTQKEREQYLKEMEKSLFEQYKPALKRFSKRQAKVLIKLVQRETNQTSYDIVKAFLGSFRATFWQGFGKLFGVSLKSEFQPAKDRGDAILERVACAVEEGTI